MLTALRSVQPRPSCQSRRSPSLYMFYCFFIINVRPISLGNAAVFLIGGLTRDVVPIPILLRSGDIIIMSGPVCRRAYHGVPRILEETLPEYLSESINVDDGTWAPYTQYMRTSRINVNVRQVFPKGFNPGLVNP